jgi:uncharacterized linocin/CFP29 family protein
MAFQTLNGSALIGQIPRNHIVRGVHNRAAMYREMVENRTLREDETREIEEMLTRVARRDLRAVADLRANGLVRQMAAGIGATTYEFDRIAPVGEATQSMNILNVGERDLVEYTRTAIPVPVTASQFLLDARQIAAGQQLGEGVDVTNAEEHTRSVLEKLEDTLVNGSDIVLGANTLPGYTNFGCREQLSYLDSEWDDPSFDLATAVADVLAMRTALRDNGFTGPYVLGIPSNYDGLLDEDYKAESDRTLRERLLAIDGVAAINVYPSLPSGEVVMVQMTPSVVQAAVGQDLTIVSYDVKGALATNWIVMAIMTFALKCANARAPLSGGVLPALTTSSGIAHLA